MLVVRGDLWSQRIPPRLSAGLRYFWTMNGEAMPAIALWRLSVLGPLASARREHGLEEMGDQSGRRRLQTPKAERAMVRAPHQCGQITALADEPGASRTDAKGPSPRFARRSRDAASVALPSRELVSELATFRQEKL